MNTNYLLLAFIVLIVIIVVVLLITKSNIVIKTRKRRTPTETWINFTPASNNEGLYISNCVYTVSEEDCFSIISADEKEHEIIIYREGVLVKNIKVKDAITDILLPPGQYYIVAYTFGDVFSGYLCPTKREDIDAIDSSNTSVCSSGLTSFRDTVGYISVVKPHNSSCVSIGTSFLSQRHHVYDAKYTHIQHLDISVKGTSMIFLIFPHNRQNYIDIKDETGKRYEYTRLPDYKNYCTIYCVPVKYTGNISIMEGSTSGYRSFPPFCAMLHNVQL